MLGDYIPSRQIILSKCVKAFSNVRGGTGICTSCVLFLAIFKQGFHNYWKNTAWEDHRICTVWQKGTTLALFTGEGRWESWGYESIGTASIPLALLRRTALCHGQCLILSGSHPYQSYNVPQRLAGKILLEDIQFGFHGFLWKIHLIVMQPKWS